MCASNLTLQQVALVLGASVLSDICYRYVIGKKYSHIIMGIAHYEIIFNLAFIKTQMGTNIGSLYLKKNYYRFYVSSDTTFG